MDTRSFSEENHSLLTLQQSYFLKVFFKKNTSPNKKEKILLAAMTGRTLQMVTRWFQNQRARFRNKKTWSLITEEMAVLRTQSREDGSGVGYLGSVSAEEEKSSESCGRNRLEVSKEIVDFPSLLPDEFQFFEPLQDAFPEDVPPSRPSRECPTRHRSFSGTGSVSDCRNPPRLSIDESGSVSKSTPSSGLWPDHKKNCPRRRPGDDVFTLNSYSFSFSSLVSQNRGQGLRNDEPNELLSPEFDLFWGIVWKYYDNFD
jgi:hypothetical protein